MNPRCPYGHAGFQDRCNRPLCHLSEHCRDRVRILEPPRELVQPTTLDSVVGTYPAPHVPQKRQTISGRLLSGCRCNKHSEDSDVWSLHTGIPIRTDPEESGAGTRRPYAISSDPLAPNLFVRDCFNCSLPRLGEEWCRVRLLFSGNNLFRASSPPIIDASIMQPYAGRD